MKVIFVPDVKDWAIGHLVNAKVKYLPQFNTKIIAIHPRDAQSKAEEFLKKVKDFNPDVIVYEYFRSAEQLINAQPELKKYKSVLVHHNQRDKALYHADWTELGINTIVTHTNKCRQKLNNKGYYNVETINHGIDLDFFKFNDIEPEEPSVGYVGRIVPWKGLKEIAESCQELGYYCEVMGKHDKPDYWNEIPKDNLRFSYFDCSDEERVDAYHNMTIYVGNSEDDYEEGTLPLLEAMACGVPVVTTPSGVANDILKNEENALVVPFKDKDALKNAIDRLMKDKELRAKLRENAWNTVKNMTEKKMALEYAHLIQNVATRDDSVSVIIPATFDRKNQVQSILDALEQQTYNQLAIEVVVVWDEVAEIKEDNSSNIPTLTSNLTFREILTNKEGYNLALARNLGAIEANGKWLLFCDSRLKPKKDAIMFFVQSANQLDKKKTWFFGNKGANKNAFVENFSFLLRDDFFIFGMMNERIDRYGGMSQEIRTRFINQGGAFSYVQQAEAEEMIKSGASKNKRDDIVNMKFKLLKMFQEKLR